MMGAVRRALPPLPKVVLSNGKRPCRGCGAEIPKGFQTWCSTGCRERGYMALSTWARIAVHKRDAGACALCGLDTDKCKRIVYALKRADNRADSEHALKTLQGVWGMRTHAYWTSWSGPAWEADHIVPLVEGGSNEIGNYRTLCVQCHKSETKALAERRALKRKRAEGGTDAS
jgi:HNH endonuclease